jgi:integrase
VGVKILGKTPKGCVAIKCSNDRLQLVYRYRGKREYLSLGLPDNRNNRKYAQSIASTIELDILSGNYDDTKERYKLFEAEPKAERIYKLELLELWDKYVEYKRPQVSLNTIANTYRQVERWLKRMPYKSVDDAVKIRDYLLRESTPYSTRRIINQLNGCCQWAIKSKLLDCNSFAGLARGLIVKDKSEIEYFTQTERSRIIEYFKLHNTHYAPFVEFMFRTGCRPSEALALQWGDISSGCDRILFARSLTADEYGSKITVKLGLKTQSSRSISCGKTLTAFLLLIAPEDRAATDLLFPSPHDTYINLPNFTDRHWKPALKQLALKYRSFYKVRHTAITHALDTLDAKDVAALVGNSAAIIYKNYAGKKEGLTIPDF